jgi:hypothetical protein
LSFAIADDDLALGEVQVFDAQADALHETEAGAIQEFGEEGVIARELPEEGADFVFGEDDREAGGLFGADEVYAFVNVLLEDAAVEEEEGGEGLVLGGGGDVAIDGKVGEESGDFGRAQVFGVLLVVEKDVTFGPVNVGVFGAAGIMFDADGGAELVEEFGGFGGHGIAFWNEIVYTFAGRKGRIAFWKTTLMAGTKGGLDFRNLSPTGVLYGKIPQLVPVRGTVFPSKTKRVRRKVSVYTLLARLSPFSKRLTSKDERRHENVNPDSNPLEWADQFIGRRTLRSRRLASSGW